MKLLEPLPTLGNRATAKHSYDVQVWWVNPETNKGGWRIVEVHATNRDQAARIAENAGYADISSVNMTG